MRKSVLFAAALAAMPVLAAPAAQATPMIGVTIESGGVVDYQSKDVGANGRFVTPIGMVGNFDVNNMVVKIGSLDLLDLSSFDVSSDTGGTLVITATATDFKDILGLANWSSQLTGNVPTGAATITLQTFIDDTNNANNPGCAVGCSLLSSLNLGGSDVAAGNTAKPFALTEVVTIKTTGPATISLDASLVYVPEPTSLAVLGMGLFAFGLTQRRQGRNAPQAV